MQDNLIDWFKSFVPAPLNAAPRHWLRAAIGVALVMPLVFLSDRWLVGTGLALQVIAPVGASAVLVFVASSSPFAQPWSVIGGNLFAALIGVSLGLTGLPSVLAATLAGAATLLCLFALRCAACTRRASRWRWWPQWVAPTCTSCTSACSGQ